MPNSLEEAIITVLNDVDYQNNLYFKSLRDGTFLKEDFIETQVQFYNAVVFFSRPMTVLAAKIPNSELRMNILRNVWEEHGEGDLEKIHGTTFLKFLSRLANQSAQDVESRFLWPEVRIFNTVLTGTCVLDEYLTGVSLLGIIERMFSDISSIIGRNVVHRGWLQADEIVHYTLHQELDIKHSQDFFDILEPLWKKHSDNRYFIEQGLWMGATLFNDLYSGLYRNRKRRLRRTVTGAHSRCLGNV